MKSIIILCGGYGRRMGQDKGLMLFHDKPLILNVFEAAHDFADEVTLVLRNDKQKGDYENLFNKHNLLKEINICKDPIEDQGPLMGILAGLNCISADEALVIPCDSPFISQSFLSNIFKYYIELYDAVVPEWPDGLLEPLHAIYNKRIIDEIGDHLKKGDRDVKSLLLDLDVRYVPVYTLDHSAKSFFNLNYPEDVQQKKRDF